MRFAVLWFTLCLALSGCPKTFDPQNPPCGEFNDCSAETLGSEFVDYVCFEERCRPASEVPAPDTGPAPDAGAAEAGPTDLGATPADAGPADAQAPDAATPGEQSFGPDACIDGVDNDQDGNTDCDDSDCANLAYCAEEICDNGFDDNANQLVDCDDPACSETPLCMPRVTICDLFDGGVFAGCDNCHSDQQNRPARGGYRVDHSSPQTLFDSLTTMGDLALPQVIEHAPDYSFMLAKLKGTQAEFGPACVQGAEGDACRTERGGRMPFGGDAMSDGEIAMVEQWIFAGDLQRCLPGFDVEDCADGVDNDNDGLTDCDDRDCSQHLLCDEPITVCDLHQNAVFNACSGCHSSESRRGDWIIDLTSPRTLHDSLTVNSQVGNPLVQHGDRLASYLFLKLTGQQENIQGGGGSSMPQGGEMFSQQSLDQIRSWIELSPSLDACLDPQ
jgi:hypothetical protein